MDEPKKKNIDIKKEKVEDLAKKISDSKSIVFADYHGLTANQIGDLRNKVREAGGELLVIKNTLLSRALTSSQFSVDSSQLTGPTATVLAYTDELAPLKELAASNKALSFPKFKFGFLDKDQLDASQLDELAKIPGREVLYAKVVGGISSPIYGFVGVLSANIRNLVSVLDQQAKKAG